MLLALLTSAMAGLDVSPTPSWVEPPTVPVDTPVPVGAVLPHTQYLLVDDQTQLHAGGGATRFVHRSYRVVTREGLESGGQLEVPYDPASEVLRFHDLQVFRDGAWSPRIDDAHTAIIQPEDDLWQGLLTGQRTLVVLVPDLSVGDIVRYSYTLESDDTLFGGRWTDGFQLAWDVPVAARTVRIEGEGDRAPSVRVHGLDTETSAAETSWSFQDLPAVVPEWNVPADVVEYPYIQGTEFQSWAEVVAWALPLYDQPADLDDVPELETPTEALDWVQDDIRYVGIELGSGSHVPRPPDRVVRLRYGDCKDKTLLLIALLRQQGITAWPALVDSEGALTEGDLPSPGAFDHVIVYIEDRGGGAFVDPTWSLQGGDIRDRYLPDYGMALLVRPGEDRLVPIERRDAPEGRSDLTWTYRVPRLGSPSVSTRTQATGGRADNLRSWFASVSEDELAADLLDQMVRSDAEVFATDPLTVVDDVAANVITLEEHYRLASAWSDDGDGGEVFPLYELSIFDLLPYPDLQRSQPLALPDGEYEVERVEIDAPPEWRFDDTSGVLSTRWFRWEVESTPGRGSLTETYTLQVTADRVAPEDMAEYRDAVDQVYTWAGFQLEREARGATEPWVWPAAAGFAVGGGVLFPIGLGVGLLLALGRRR